MKVVHVKHSPYTHYIGRTVRGYKGSPLRNPYKITDTCTREEVIEKFEVYARNNPVIMDLIRDLPAEAVLGCWCAPKHACHGDIIIKLWLELHI